MAQPPLINLPERLSCIARICEIWCVAGCCGIGAFDFSPINIAYYICSSTSETVDQQIERLGDELRILRSMVSGMPPNDSGYICSIGNLADSFSLEDFELLLAELESSIAASRKLIELNQSLELPRERRLALKRDYS